MAILPEPTPTPGPNPTYIAIARMLTQTRAAPTPTRTPSPSPTHAITPSPTVEVPVTGSRKLPAQAGKPLEISGIKIAILAVRMEQSAGRLKAEENNMYLDLEVQILNNTVKTFPYNPMDFRLTGEYNSTFQPAVDALKPVLLSGELDPGEWVRGHLAFSVPQAMIASLVRYRPVQTASSLPIDAWFDLSPLASGQPQPISPPSTAQDWPGTSFPGTGERVEIEGVGLTIEKAEVNARMLGRKAEKGQRFIVLTVKIENTGRTRMPFNPLYFRVKDRDGYEYLPVIGSPETSLQAGSLARGRMVRNIIIFEVPETDLHLVVTYQPTVLFEEYHPIRLRVDLPDAAK